MAQSGTAQDGGLNYTFGDGGADWWGENRAEDRNPGHVGEGPDLALRREDRDGSSPTHQEAGGSGTPDFGITEWTPYRRPWYRKPSVILKIGAVVAFAVAAVVLVVGRDGSAAGNETTVTPAPTTSSISEPAPPPPRSEGTPQTAALLPPPPPPPPTAEQVTPPPVVTRQWPRYESPAQTEPLAPRVSSPPSMSFAPKPVTPPQTATPGTNRGGHHGFF
jgi:hypothetical protein